MCILCNVWGMKNIQFNVLSPEAVRGMSVCEVVTDELYENNCPKVGGLRDPRFGVSSRRGLCKSCGMTWSKCSGHFGHYELPHPVYHIGWTVEVLYWLRKSCVNCGHVQCGKLAKKCPKCSKQRPKFTRVNSTLMKIQDEAVSRELFADEAYKYLEQISKEDVLKCRPKKDGFHPSHLILKVIPIPPNCVRPSPTMDGDEVRGEDGGVRRVPLPTSRAAPLTLPTHSLTHFTRLYLDTCSPSHLFFTQHLCIVDRLFSTFVYC